MSPGPLTSFARGGFGYHHPNGGFSRFGAPAVNRSYDTLPTGARRQKFYVDDSGVGHFEAGDKLVLEVDEDGGVTIALEPPKTGNGKGKGRSLFSRREKMAISTSNDGTVTVRPEGDGTLEVVGDPLSGAVTIIELHPEPLNGPNGG